MNRSNLISAGTFQRVAAFEFLRPKFRRSALFRVTSRPILRTYLSYGQK